MVILVFTFAFLMFQITKVGGNVALINQFQNCHAMTEAQCQFSPNLKKYIECWKESIEPCGYDNADNQMRIAGGDCVIEERLITENVCYMPDMCQEVTYTEYFLVYYE